MGCIGACFACIGNTIYYLVNFIFLIVGIACLCGGTILLVSFECTVERLIYQFFSAIGLSVTQAISTSDSSLTVDFNITAIVLLSVGAFLVLLSMLAFIGIAIKAFEKIVVFVYIIFSVALFGGLIFLIVFFALPAPKPEGLDVVGASLDLFLPNYVPITGDVKNFTIEGALIDMIQSNFHCCGVNGIDDFTTGDAKHVSTTYYDMTYWNGTNNMLIRVPPTCCRTTIEQQSGNDDSFSPMGIEFFPTPWSITAPACYTDKVSNATLVHTNRSCSKAIYDIIEENNVYILVATSILAAIFLALIFALFAKLCNCCGSDKKKKNDVESKNKAAPTPAPVPAVAYPGYPATNAYPGYPAAYPAYPPAAAYPPQAQRK